MSVSRCMCLCCRRHSEFSLTIINGMSKKYDLMQSQNQRLREGLEKIAEFETAEDKYNSYESGWFGVAKFARQILTEIDGVKE